MKFNIQKLYQLLCDQHEDYVGRANTEYENLFDYLSENMCDVVTHNKISGLVGKLLYRATLNAFEDGFTAALALTMGKTVEIGEET